MTTDDRIADAEASLRLAKQAVDAEIRAYPRPISGCDAQFNTLLAQRQRLNAALVALARQPLIPTSREPDPRPVWREVGERLNATQTGLVTAASFRT